MSCYFTEMPVSQSSSTFEGSIKLASPPLGYLGGEAVLRGCKPGGLGLPLDVNSEGSCNLSVKCT